MFKLYKCISPWFSWSFVWHQWNLKNTKRIDRFLKCFLELPDYQTFIKFLYLLQPCFCMPIKDSFEPIIWPSNYCPQFYHVTQKITTTVRSILYCCILNTALLWTRKMMFVKRTDLCTSAVDEVQSNYAHNKLPIWILSWNLSKEIQTLLKVFSQGKNCLLYFCICCSLLLRSVLSFLIFKISHWG